MTNQMIIFWASVELMEQGILKPTGEKIVVKDQDGKDKELDVPEEIHTYQHWKDLGYQVQKPDLEAHRREDGKDDRYRRQ